MHMRLKFAEPFDRRRFIKNEDRVNTLKRGNDFSTLKLGVDGAGVAFVAFDRCVRIDPDDQDVAMTFGLFEIADVADMEDVEAAVGGHDGHFSGLCSPGERQCRPKRQYFRSRRFCDTLRESRPFRALMGSKSTIFNSAFQRHTDVVAQSMQHIMSDVEKSGKLLVTALKSGKKVLVCGNGGSAADSQHLAAELSGRYKKERKALAGIALTTDTSALTAIGNDYGFENIFKRQIAALGMKGDVLVAFSTSGSSPNILAAIAEARACKMKVIALTGIKGRGLRKSVDALICVPTEETARIQEIHELVYHSWCEYIDSQLGSNF